MAKKNFGLVFCNKEIYLGEKKLIKIFINLDSEIMLQQTTVATVIPFYKKIFKKWPNLKSFFGATLRKFYMNGKVWDIIKGQKTYTKQRNF